MSDALFHAAGERGSGDIDAEAFSAGIRIDTSDEDGLSHSEISFDAALRLGTWLIAQAIAGGARPLSDSRTGAEQAEGEE